MTGKHMEITRIEWHPKPVLDLVDRVGRDANRAGAETFLAAAAPRIPRDTGELAASGSIVEGDDSVAVGWEAEHAVFVHARGVVVDDGDAHWPEATIAADGNDIGGRIAETFRSGWPGG